MGESASSPEEEELWGRLLRLPFHGGRIADPRVKAGWHVLPGAMVGAGRGALRTRAVFAQAACGFR